MFQYVVQGASAEGIPGSSGLNGLHRESRSLHAHSLIVCTAAFFAHSEKDERNIVFLLKVSNPFVIIFFSGYKLDLIVGYLQDITVSETVFHLLFCKIKRTPQRRS